MIYDPNKHELYRLLEVYWERKLMYIVLYTYSYISVKVSRIYIFVYYAYHDYGRIALSFSLNYQFSRTRSICDKSLSSFYWFF